MKVRVFTLSFDEQAQGFVSPQLDAWMSGVEVHRCAEHFFERAGLPYCSLVITYHDRTSRLTTSAAPVSAAAATSVSGSKVVGSRPAKPSDGREALTSTQRKVFERVRLWRNELAVREGKPPYALLTNKQLVELAVKMPKSLKALREIEGIGAARAEQLGAALIEELHLEVSPSDELATEAAEETAL